MSESRQCPECKKTITITAEGIFRKHTKSTWLGGSNYKTEPCITPTEVKIPTQVFFSGGPPGWIEAQQKAYMKLGLKWPPKRKD